MWFILALVWTVGLSIGNVISWAFGAMTALEAAHVSFAQGVALFCFAFTNRSRFEE